MSDKKVKVSHYAIFAVLSLGFPLFLLILVEIVFRIAAPQPDWPVTSGLFMQRDGVKIITPNMHGTAYSREYFIKVAGDSSGYRLGASNADPTREAAVWLFGDSQLFGWGVEVHDTASALLGRMGIPIVSRAIPADGLDSYIARLRALIAVGVPPVEVVLVLYDNDLPVDVRRDPASGQVLSSPPPAPNIEFNLRMKVLQLHSVRALGRLINGSPLSDWFADKTGYQIGRMKQLHFEMPRYYKSTVATGTIGSGLEKLRTFFALVRSVHSPIRVVRIVSATAAGGATSALAIRDLGDDPANFEFDKVDEVLATFCLKENVPYSSLSPRDDHEERQWFFKFDIHLRPEGHRALADHLKPLLLRHKTDGVVGAYNRKGKGRTLQPGP